MNADQNFKSELSVACELARLAGAAILEHYEGPLNIKQKNYDDDVEPVTQAAAGSPMFKIERRENKVFTQPLEEGASTNLFVWTASGRWNYELIPAASLATMHFAIDQDVAPRSSNQNGVTADSPASDSGISTSFAEDMLLLAKPIRNGTKLSTNAPVNGRESNNPEKP